jgi:hypothetical protein
MIRCEVGDGLGGSFWSTFESGRANKPHYIYTFFFPGSKITFFINFRNRHNIFIAEQSQRKYALREFRRIKLFIPNRINISSKIKIHDRILYPL